MATNDRKKAAAARAAARQDPAELVAALEAERAGYVARGLDDRAKSVDKEIAAWKRMNKQQPKDDDGTPADANKGQQQRRVPRGSAKPPAGEQKPAGDTPAGEQPADGQEPGDDQGKSQG